MSNEFSSDAVVSHLASQSNAVGQLAQDSGAFAAAVAAFESKDPDAFRWVLNHREMLPYCELICDWVRVKMCVLRCFEVCGLPQEKVTAVDLPQFASAIVQLASNDKLLRRVVDAVSCGDGDDYRAAINELKLGEYCHLLCHWVCAIIYRRVCERVCSPVREPLTDAASEIRAASRVFAKLVENEKALQEISKAAVAIDCGLLGSSIRSAGFGPWCELICCWICVWWCAYACREVCGVPDPVRIEVDEIEEARNFALAARKIAAQPRALGDLVKAVGSRDAKAYGEIVARYGLGPYCYQLCAWVCSGICYEFCICVCPKSPPDPWFTTVGYFNVFTDIDPSGKTNKGLPNPSLAYHGGPNFAFFGPLQFGGYCPYDSPTFPGTPMKYRFLYDNGGGPLPIAGSLVSPVEAGQRWISWLTNVAGKFSLPPVSLLQSVYIQAAPTPPDPPAPVIGNPYAPPSPHYITPDVNGWVDVDANALGGFFATLLGFDSTQVVAGGVPLPLGTPGRGAPLPNVPAGTAVPAAKQRAGTDVSIIFEATRTTTFPPGTTADYNQTPVKLHINNWEEVTELDFAEFSTSCCTPIDKTLHVEFTVDHEELNAGTWSLVITSCCGSSAPGNITPPNPTAGVTFTAGDRGASGTILEDTTTWGNCSYTADLYTTPKLTTGLLDRGTLTNQLTFAICNHTPC
jgi:hypothetical protein